MSKVDWKNKDLLEKIVKESITQSETLLKLGLTKKSGNFQTLLRNIKKYNIDISHFNGKEVAYKKLNLFNVKNPRNMMKHEDFFRLNKYITGASLKKRILKESLKLHECAECRLKPQWNGKDLSLQVDHINGDNLDNRLENLRFLCPNCHSQTLNFSGKKLKKEKVVNSIFKIEIFEKNRKAPSKDEVLKKLEEKSFRNIYKHYQVGENNFKSLCDYYEIDLELYKSTPKLLGVNKIELQKLLLEKPLTGLQNIFNVSGNGIKKYAKKNKLFLPTTISKGYWAKVKSGKINKVKFEDLILIEGEYNLKGFCRDIV